MEYQRGQVLLIVVLVMVTVLTIGLSVAARTITNIRTSEEVDNSEKAFSAAEAGIEQSLTTNEPVTGSFGNNSSFETTINTIEGNEFTLNDSLPVEKDSASDIWLSEYPSYANQWSGTLTLHWGEAGGNCNASEAINSNAALEVVVLSGGTANPVVDRFALDPCSQRRLNNNFEFISVNPATIDGRDYQYQRTFTVNSGLFIRVIPLYSSANIAVRSCDSAGNNCNPLPSQGTVIESIGSADNTQRRLVTVRLYPKLPTELFPYSFFIPQ